MKIDTHSKKFDFEFFYFKYLLNKLQYKIIFPCYDYSMFVYYIFTYN